MLQCVLQTILVFSLHDEHMYKLLLHLRGSLKISQFYIKMWKELIYQAKNCLTKYCTNHIKGKGFKFKKSHINRVHWDISIFLVYRFTVGLKILKNNYLADVGTYLSLGMKYLVKLVRKQWVRSLLNGLERMVRGILDNWIMHWHWLPSQATAIWI